ncbi:MAG: hypothetical protein GQ576_07020 [Methanococcoides sp.]|nr:hypothetical protein [Methanococcoides sp.]
MKKSYTIVIFIFIFSLTSTAINDIDIFTWNTNTDTGITQNGIIELNNTVYGSVNVDGLESEDDTFGLFAGVQMVINSVGILIKSIGATLVIYPTLINIGFPGAIAAIFQGVTTVIEGIAIAEFMSGRRATN